MNMSIINYERLLYFIIIMVKYLYKYGKNKVLEEE